jgi:hypothetical protein
MFRMNADGSVWRVSNNEFLGHIGNLTHPYLNRPRTIIEEKVTMWWRGLLSYKSEPEVKP